MAHRYMNKENNDMDKFLRGSLGNLEVQPSQNVWKSLSKRLLILELVRLNFTNIGKFWIYSGLATLTTLAGLSLYSINSDKPQNITVETKTEMVHEMELASKPNNKELNSTKFVNNKDAIKNANSNISVSQNPNLEQSDLFSSAEKKIFNANQSISEQRQSGDLGNGKSLEKESTEKIVEQIPGDNNSRENINLLITNSNQADVDKNIERDIDHNEKLTRLESHVIAKQAFALYLFSQDGSIGIPPLKTSQQVKPTDFSQLKAGNITKSQKIGKKRKLFQNNHNQEIETSKKSSAQWFASINYKHDWSTESMLPQSNMLALKGGFTRSRWSVSLGLGLQGDESNTEYEFIYSTFDSVGFFYDIDYYETIPGNPDSIIIHYTINPVFDTVAHSSLEQGKESSRWVVIPIELGYEIFQTKSYIIKLLISASIGWEYYREKGVPVSLPQGIGTSYSKKGLSSVSPFITTGFGLENQIKIYDKWWFIIEPQIYYHMKAPYKWDGSKTLGPLGFGINAGIKYKF